jgi:hypothetical protein
MITPVRSSHPDLERQQFVASDEVELLAIVRQDYDQLASVVTRLV